MQTSRDVEINFLWNSVVQNRKRGKRKLFQLDDPLMSVLLCYSTLFTLAREIYRSEQFFLLKFIKIYYPTFNLASHELPRLFYWFSDFFFAARFRSFRRSKRHKKLKHNDGIIHAPYSTENERCAYKERYYVNLDKLWSNDFRRHLSAQTRDTFQRETCHKKWVFLDYIGTIAADMGRKCSRLHPKKTLLDSCAFNTSIQFITIKTLSMARTVFHCLIKNCDKFQAILSRVPASTKHAIHQTRMIACKNPGEHLQSHIFYFSIKIESIMMRAGFVSRGLERIYAFSFLLEEVLLRHLSFSWQLNWFGCPWWGPSVGKVTFQDLFHSQTLQSD